MNKKDKIYLYLFLTLCLIFIGISVKNIYNMSSVVTDDNIYQDLPSKIYVQNSISAFKKLGIENNKEVIEETELPKGAILLKFDNKEFSNSSEIEEYILQSKNKSFNIEIFKPSVNDSIVGKRYGYVIKKKDILSETFTDFNSAVIISYILKGGASERAGLKIGDIITKVNGKNFSSAVEAFKITLQNSSENTVYFTVLRQGKYTNINVKLTTIKLTFNVLFTYLIGLFLILFSMFIAFNRFHIFQGKIISFTLFSLGLYLAFLPYSTYNYNLDLFLLKLLFSEFTFSLFFVMLFHSFAYFPFEKKKLLNKMSLLIYPYYVTALFLIVFTIITYSEEYNYLLTDLQLIFIVILLIYYSFIFIKHRDKKKSNPFYGKAVAIAYLLNFVLILYNYLAIKTFETELFEYYYIFLVLIPLAYIYTISKYDLLDSLLKFRKNIQYFIISIVINLILSSILVYSIFLLSKLNIQLPNLHFTGSSIEVLDRPLRPELFNIYSKVLFLILSGLSFLILHNIRKVLFTILDKKYHIVSFNYQVISEELSEEFQNQTNLESLSQLILDKLEELIKLKQCGIIVFEDEKKVIHQSYRGIIDINLKEYIHSSELNLIRKISSFSGNVLIEYLEGELKNILLSCKYKYMIPLRVKGKILGIVLLGEKLSESRLKSNDLLYSNAIAKQAAISIENFSLYSDLAKQERIKQELEIAREIQLSSLPRKLPTINGLDISGISLPALEVGGDYYDIFIDKQNSNLITAIIGDVSGKGTSAALYMSKIQGVVKTLQEFNLGIKELMIKTNELIFTFLNSGSFITAFCVKFNIKEKEIRMTRAGHLPIYYYNSQLDKLEIITPKGIALGLNTGELFNRNLEELMFNYNINDVFVLVTDGITEARNANQKEYEEERLLNVIKNSSSLTSTQIRDNLIDDIKLFTGRTTQFDDITILIIKAVE